MATLHVRQFPDALHQRLAKLAEQERRSLSSEVIVLLKRELSKPPVSTREALTMLDRWRLRPSGKGIPSSLKLLKADRRR